MKTLADLEIPGENTSGVVPMQYKVLVKVEEAKAKSAGGILIPESSKAAMQFEVTRGRICAIGPAAFSDKDQYPEGAPHPNLGDYIWFDKHSGTQMRDKTVDRVLWRVIEDTDITGLCVRDDQVQELKA